MTSLLEQRLPRDPLFEWRKKGWDRFCQFEMPWLRNLSFPEPAPVPLAKLSSPSSFCVVFIDGFFSEEMSRLPSSLICLPLDQAIRSYPLFLHNRIARTLKGEHNPLAALNLAFQGKGAFLYLPPQTVLKEPLEIVHLFTSDQMATPRLMLYLGQGASLHLVQQIEKASFCNGAIDAVLEKGATLFLREEQTASKAYFQNIRALLKTESRFQFALYAAGSSRTSLHIELAEENSEALLQGVSQLHEENELHLSTLVEHQAPMTRSRQHFKGVLRDQSRSSFEGKIFVRPQAQKTEAYQLNNHLLLSDGAMASTKPNLEIFADDVKASHGATVAQLDEEELFYLRSRGLSALEARQWLIEGFCHELAHCLPTRRVEPISIKIF